MKNYFLKIFIEDPIQTTDKYCTQNDNPNQTNLSNQSYLDFNDNTCVLYQNSFETIDKTHRSTPNRALISFLLLIGTCALALSLKKLRRSVFFGSYVRRTLSDIGMFISIVLMVVVDNIVEKQTGIETNVIHL